MTAQLGHLRLRDALPIWWQVARPWFSGSSRLQALRYVAVCVGLAVLHTLVAVRVSFAQKHFSTALSEKNKAAWMSAVWEFVVIICLFAPIRSLESYAEKRMVAVWRTYLTHTFIQAYTSNKAYFHMQLARGTEGTQAGPEDQDVAAAVHNAAGITNSSSSSSSSSHKRTATQELLAGAGSSKDSAVMSLAHSPVSRGGLLPKLRTLRSSGSDVQLAQRGGQQLQEGPLTTHSSRSHSFDVQQRWGTKKEQETTPLLGTTTTHSHTPQQQPAQQQSGAAAVKAGGVVGQAQEGVGVGGVGGVVAGLSDASAQVDNPDQRITADVSNYVQTSVGLVLLLVRKTLNCAAFAGVLWSISPTLVIFLLSYALFGTFGTAAVFGAPLTRLKQKLLRLEADLRFGLVRLRENAEAIAFYGGDVHEASDLSSRLVVVLDVLLQRIAWLGGYELWLVVYRYATILIPSLVLAPEYFAGLIEFGTMTQASFAFNVLEEALRLILEKMEDLSSLAAETGRLAGLLAALRAADVDAGGDGTVTGFGSPPKHSSSSSSSSLMQSQLLLPVSTPGSTHDVELAATAAGGGALQAAAGSSGGNGVLANGGVGVGDGVRLSRVLRLLDGSVGGLCVEGLTACVPGRHHQAMVVCEDLSFTLEPGESLLIMGPSGCGKSSLLRIIAGLWTVGGGTIRGPAQPFFLPQKPFMPLGSLRQQLLFPTDCPNKAVRAAAAAAAAAGGGSLHNTPPSRTQEHESEATPLLAGRDLAAAAGGSSSSASSTAVKPSSVLHRLAGHTRTGSTASTRHSFEPDPPTTAAAAAGGGYGVGSSSSSSSSHDNAGPAAAADGGSLVLDIHSHSSSMDVSSIDAQLQALLVSVRLGHLLHRFPAGLDAEVDWASVLSLGEQQRVALVRLLMHRPLLAFLDEATAALDPKSEAVVYGLIADACSCYVSVGHRLQLLEWHSHVLVSAGSGGGHWAKYTTAEFKQRLAAGLEG